LKDILREAQGLDDDGDDDDGDFNDDDGYNDSNDSLMHDDEDSLYGGPAALVLDRQVEEENSDRQHRRRLKGSPRTKRTANGQVVKDLRTPAMDGNYADRSRYDSTGRK